MDGLLVATVGAFAVLCAVALRRGLLYHHGASTWLALTFASIAVAGLVAPQLDAAQSPTGQLGALVGVGLGLLVHPVALVEFAHTLQPVPRFLRRGLVVAALVLLVGVVAIGVADPNAFDDDRSPGVGALVVLVSTSMLWLTVAVFVGVRLVRLAAGLTSSLGRARARTMAAGVLALAPAVVAPFLLPGLTQAAGVSLALVACALTWLGYVPPRWLRWTWARQDSLRLAEAEAAALRDPTVDMTEWLRIVMQVSDADAAWLEVRGQLVATAGRPDGGPAVPVTVGAQLDGVHVLPSPDGTWALVASVAGGRLTARTRLDPVLFGDDASDIFLLTAARMRSTVVRRSVELREREEAAERQQAQHQAATSRLREDVLSTLSHELRTPLVTLRGVPETLLRRWGEVSPEDARALLERMNTNARSLHRLVESTLLLAQVRAGEVDPRRADCQALRVVDHALRRLTHVGVDVDRVATPEDLNDVQVRTDQRLAGAVLAELVHNALTYSDAPAPVRISIEVAGDHVGVSVQDQGRGLGTEEPRSLLEAFQRAGDLLTRDRRGLGIGLTLVSELAPLLDATLSVASTQGGGTVVTLLLPPAAAATPVAQPTDRVAEVGEDQAPRRG